MNGDNKTEMDYIFLMQDVRGYIRVFGADQFLHDLHDIFPDEYMLIVDALRRKEIKDFNNKKKAYLLEPKE